MANLYTTNSGIPFPSSGNLHTTNSGIPFPTTGVLHTTFGVSGSIEVFDAYIALQNGTRNIKIGTSSVTPTIKMVRSVLSRTNADFFDQRGSGSLHSLQAVNFDQRGVGSLYSSSPPNFDQRGEGSLYSTDADSIP